MTQETAHSGNEANTETREITADVASTFFDMNRLEFARHASGIAKECQSWSHELLWNQGKLAEQVLPGSVERFVAKIRERLDWIEETKTALPQPPKGAPNE